MKDESVNESELLDNAAIDMLMRRTFFVQSLKASNPDEAIAINLKSGLLDQISVTPQSGINGFSFQIDYITIGSVIIMKYIFSGVGFTGCAGGDLLHYIIHESGGWKPSNPSRASNVLGTEFGAVMQPDGMDFTYLSEQFEAIDISFHIPALQKHIDAAYGILDSQQIIFDCISNGMPSNLHNLRNLARLIIDDARNGASLLSLGNTGEELEQILYAALLSGTAHDRLNHFKQVGSVAPRQIVRAERYIREYADKQSITLSDLVAVSGVSARALHDGFLRFRGMSPMAYLRRYRMQKVREALQSAGQDVTVTAEAARWGFLQPGRFAVEYKKLFGESPSQTVQHTLGRRYVLPARDQDNHEP